jgi:cation diffusion facilitator family transporter
MVNQSKQTILWRTTLWSLMANVVLTIVKWCAGSWGHSYALIADAIESTSDVFASLLVLFGLLYANRPADKNHPYGHGKAEPLVTFLVVLFLLTSAILIAHDSWKNIHSTHAAPQPFTLWILGAIILYKEFLYRWMKHRALSTQSTILRSEAWHHRADAVTSLAAFVGISVALWMGPGYEMADDWAALFAAGIIVYNCYQILRPALGEIMDEHAYDDLAEHIRMESMKIEGVKMIEKCFIRKAGAYYHIDLHVQVNPQITVHEGHRIAHQVKDHLRNGNPEIGNVLIHVEPYHNR